MGSSGLVSADNGSRQGGSLPSGTRFSTYFENFRGFGEVSEWGAPVGHFARVVPAKIASALGGRAIWVTDIREARIYPAGWASIGVDLERMHFLETGNALKAMKTAVFDGAFKVMIVDTDAFIGKGEMSFLASMARQRDYAIFLIRKFFLSHRNGNPFARHRFNCSYSLARDRFHINTIKGANTKRLVLRAEEVARG